MTASDHFRTTVRHGRRVARGTVVLHGLAPTGGISVTAKRGNGGQDPGCEVGFVVSRAVGNAVTRNRVKRQLRHISRDLIADLDPGSMIVVRALPASAQPVADLEQDLRSAWSAWLDKNRRSERR